VQKFTKGVTCPRCHKFKDTRRVPPQPGIDPRLKHYVCDHCKIGWYQSRATGKIIGTLEDARRAYIEKESKHANRRSQ
jgi:transposase-like protein